MSVSRSKRFSPHSGAILEIRTPRDLEIVKKLYANGVLLGDKSPDGWNIRYHHRVPHDERLRSCFPPRWKWEDKGYRPDEYGHWLLGNWQPYDGTEEHLAPSEGVDPVRRRRGGGVIGRGRRCRTAAVSGSDDPPVRLLCFRVPKN